LLEKHRSMHTVTKCNSGHQIKDKKTGEDFRANRINDILYAYAERQKINNKKTIY